MKKMFKLVIKIVVGFFLFIFLMGACSAFFGDDECDFDLEDYNGDGQVTAVDHDYKKELEQKCEDGY